MSAAGLKTFEQLYQAPNLNLQPAQNNVPENIQKNSVDNKGLENGDTITIAGKEIKKKNAIIGLAGFAALAAFILFNFSKKGNILKLKTPASENLPEIGSRLNAEPIHHGPKELAAHLNNIAANIEEMQERALSILERANKYVKRVADIDLSEVTPDAQGRKIVVKNGKKHSISSIYTHAGGNNYMLTQIQAKKLGDTKEQSLFTVKTQGNEILSCKIKDGCRTIPESGKLKGIDLQIRENGYLYHENGVTLEISNGSPVRYFKSHRNTQSEPYNIPGNNMQVVISKNKIGPAVEYDEQGMVTKFADGITKTRIDTVSKGGDLSIGEEHIDAKYFLEANEAGELVKADKSRLEEFVYKLV